MWRATPKYKGERLKTKIFKTKKAAIEWEREQKDQAKEDELSSLRGPDLLTICSKYLIYAERYTKKVYEEKFSLINNRLLKYFDKDMPIEDITQESIEEYLDKQRKERSANAANKDRKNLLALWNKAVKTYGVESNPVSGTERFPHDRQPQYTPPTKDVLKLLAAATRKETAFLYAYIYTGARRSEIYRWIWNEDINFERRTYRLGTRKNRDGSMSYEWFPMPDELYEQLWW